MDTAVTSENVTGCHNSTILRHYVIYGCRHSERWPCLSDVAWITNECKLKISSHYLNFDSLLASVTPAVQLVLINVGVLLEKKFQLFDFILTARPWRPDGHTEKQMHSKKNILANTEVRVRQGGCSLASLPLSSISLELKPCWPPGMGGLSTTVGLIRYMFAFYSMSNIAECARAAVRRRRAKIEQFKPTLVGIC